jgi:hypothetical protein
MLRLCCEQLTTHISAVVVKRLHTRDCSMRERMYTKQVLVD